MSEPTNPNINISSANPLTLLSEATDTATAKEHPPSPSHPTSPIPEETPAEILKRTLSLRPITLTPIIPTIPSHTPLPTTSPSTPTPTSNQHLQIIGLGTCGTVFSIPHTPLAYKKGSDVTAMWNDFCLTNKVHNAILDTRGLLQEAFKDVSDDITIPQTPLCYEFILPSSTEWWVNNLRNFPKSHRKTGPGALFLADKIPALGVHTQEALVKEYFDVDKDKVPEKHLQFQPQSTTNTHCLIRPYLGENAPHSHSHSHNPHTSLSLLNFPLHLSTLKSLSLNLSALASSMAIGLAIVHWEAQVDGMDMEFVLGASNCGGWGDGRKGEGEGEKRGYVPEPEKDGKDNLDPSPSREINPLLDLRSAFFNSATAKREPQPEQQGAHLYILDFDKASPITLCPRAIDKNLVPAFLGNDPYYPRPPLDITTDITDRENKSDSQTDRQIWKHFCSVYLKASRVILGNKLKELAKGQTETEKEKEKENVNMIMALPQLFLDKVEETIKKHSGWKAEDMIVFG